MKIAKCVCGSRAVVSGGANYSFVGCVGGEEHDAGWTCWLGPSKNGPKKAIKAWNKLMKKAKSG